MKKNKCSATGKTIFITKEKADQALISLKSASTYNNILFKNNKKCKNKVEQKRAYFCLHCKGYHLTSQTKQDYKPKPTDKEINKLKFLRSFDIEKWKQDSLPFESGHMPQR